MEIAPISVTPPGWLATFTDWSELLQSDEDRMRLAIALSRENVERGTGGPFGALIVESETGKIVAAGTNSVLRLNNSTLHGEMVAFMVAQQRLRSFTLAAPGMAAHELVTSCEPCAMCLGAALWSGVKRVVSGASREDATRLRFEEGPVFPQSYAYLESRGVTFTRNVLREEARVVLEMYRAKGGMIYNA
ncbi:MAG: nucleoside deaminase [Gemmatimonadaceae bacterium]